MVTRFVKRWSLGRANSLRLLYLKIFGNNKIIGKRNGNFLMRDNALLSKCTIVFHGKNNIVKFGEGNRLTNCSLQIFGDNCQIELGSRNILQDTTFWLEDNGSSISIGNDNTFCGELQLAAVEGTSITIGNNCLFSSGIHITTTDSHSILNLEGERINPSKPIVFNDHIWVGTRAIILKNVSISSNVVIGAGSIVNRSIQEPNVAVAGNPAQIVKRGIDWNINRV